MGLLKKICPLCAGGALAPPLATPLSSESLSQLGPIAATATLDGGEFLVGLLDGDEAPFGVASLRLGGRVNLVWMILAHQLPIALRQLLL